MTVSLENICTQASGHTFSFRLWYSIPVTFFFSHRSVRTMLVQKGDEMDFYTNSSGIAKQEGESLNLQVSFTCRLIDYRGNQENRMKNIVCLY